MTVTNTIRADVSLHSVTSKSWITLLDIVFTFNDNPQLRFQVLKLYQDWPVVSSLIGTYGFVFKNFISKDG